MRVLPLIKHLVVIWPVLAAAALCLPAETAHGDEGQAPGEVVSIAVGPILPPLLDRDADGHLTGFAIDFLTEAARRAGLPVEFVFVPDEAAVRALKPERTPLLSWLLFEETMNGWTHFERSYLTLHTAVFRRRDSTGKGELRAIDLGEIIAVEGSEAHRDLLDDGAIKIFTVPAIDDAVRLLASGEHDTIFANQMGVLDAIRRLRLDSIVEVASPEMHMHQRIRLHRAESRADLETALEPILRSMRHDGGFDTAYTHWFGPLEEDEKISRRVFTLTVGSVSLGGALLGLVLFVSRRRLRALARGLGEDLHQSESRLGALLGDVEAIVWEATPEAQFTYVSPYAETMLGYAAETWLRPDFFPNILLHPEDRDATVRACREATESGQDHELEYRALTSTGKVVWLNDVIRVVKDESGKAVCLRGVMVDVTARRQSQDAVHASEARLAAIMDASPTGIFRLDLEGRVTFGNQEAARITGIQSGLIDLKRWLQAIHPDDRSTVSAAWRRVRDETVPDHREYRFVHPGGEVVWVLDRGVPERDVSGRITGFVGTLTDITQIKHNEETIRTHSQVFLNMREGVNTVDEDRNILYANAAFEKMFGYEPGELIGRNISILSPASPGEYEQRRADVRRELIERGSWSGEMRNRRKDGSVFWTRVHLSRVEGAGPTYAVCVQEDITEAKRAREALRESEEKFRRVAESALVGIAITDRGRFTFSNDAMIQLTGYTPKDLESLNREGVIKLLVGEELQAAAYAALIRLDNPGASTEPIVIEEAPLRHKDGSERWARLTVSRLFPDQPFPRLFVAADITARKCAEQSLRTHSQVLMSMAEGVVFTDETGFVIETNPSFDAMFGYGAGELPGRHVAEISHATRDTVDLRIGQINAEIGAKGIWTGVFRSKRKDGSLIWTRARITWTKIGGKKALVSVQEDITEAMRAEEALKESEEKFRRVAESALVGIALYDGTRYTFVNRTMMALFGRADAPEIETLGRADLADLFFDGPEKERILDALCQLDGQEGQLAPVILDDVRLKHPDGGDRWASVMFNRLHPDRLFPRVTVCVDTTQRKLAELALRESEQKFRRVAESAMVGIAITEHERYTYVNDALIEITGYGRGELTGLDRASRLSKLFVPEDAQRIAELAAGADSALGAVPPSRFPELRLRRKDGTLRHVSLFMSPMYPNRAYPVLIVVVDITERKLAEEALRAREDSLRRTEQLARIGSWEYRADGASGGWSEGVRRIHEVSDDYMPTLESGLSFFLPADRERLLALAGEAMQTGTPWKFEGQLTTAKDRKIWVRSTGEPIWEKGQIVGLVGAIQDVTDLRTAETSLRLSEALFRAISEQMPDCLLLLNLDDPEVPGRIQYANEAAARMHGMTLDELVGLPISALDTPGTARHAPDRLDRLRAGDTIYFEGEHVRKDGSIFPVDVVARKIPALGENVVLAINRDITERRKAEEERRRVEARMQQTQRLESLGVLTGGIAHDFNNLLAGILGHADLAREDAPASGPIRESVEQIEIAARRAADLVRQMLAYAGRGTFVVRRVHLGEMVRELSKLLEVTLSKKATLQFEIDGDAPPIAADATQIQQVVMNLITNASDALGDQPGTITLRSGTIEYTGEALRAYAPHEPPHPGRFVFLEVTDTGCGMDAATLDRIFDPYFSTKFTGRGLGLAAALGIIRGHHGGLRVTSRVGRGTTFRVIFPAAADGELAAPDPVPAADRVPSRAGTLLIVDDEARVRDFLVRALQRFGHEVLVAADGRQALEVYDRHRDCIDAVLLDVTMPEMDGREVLRALHARQPGLPVMLMSGFTEADMRAQHEGNGYASFLQKPFSLDTLRAAVDALLVQK